MTFKEFLEHEKQGDIKVERVIESNSTSEIIVTDHYYNGDQVFIKKEIK